MGLPQGLALLLCPWSSPAEESEEPAWQSAQSASKEADTGPGQLAEDGFPSRSRFNSSKGFKRQMSGVCSSESKQRACQGYTGDRCSHT